MMFKLDDEIVNTVTKRISLFLGNDLLESSFSTDMPVFTLESSRIVDLLRFIHDEPALQFIFLTTLCGVHYPENNRFAVVYHLHSFKLNLRIRLKINIPVDTPEVRTASGVFSAANWMERETYDFYGIIFTGHPNLKRILNVDEMDYFPMRKEYPLEDGTREDKDDKMFGR
jgi:NADH-quinone oxidoreductase subunit C